MKLINKKKDTIDDLVNVKYDTKNNKNNVYDLFNKMKGYFYS